jgi:hypothetical protein
MNGNQWKFTGMLSTMSRCADYFRNFQISAVAMETAKMLKNWKTQKWSEQVTRQTEIDQTC